MLYDEQLNDQVNTIRQTFGYVKRYHQALFVIKIDSALIEDPLFPLLMKDIVQLHDAGIKIALVPGTRERINQILSSFKISTQTVDGMRISTDEAIPFIKMAAFDVSNKLMTILAENSANAVIGNWVRARSIGVHDGVDFQSTGAIDKVDIDSIKNVLDDNMIPIFPNIGWSRTGKPYNISSTELALQLSSALHARKLFFITADEGKLPPSCVVPVEVQRTSEGKISQLTIREAEILLAENLMELENSPSESYIKLIEKSCIAAKNGVPRIHIIDGRVDGMLLKEIFSNRGFGTMIYTNEHENIRSLQDQDISEILRITSPLVAKGVLVARSADTIIEHQDEYVVYEVDNTIHGCGALKIYEGTVGEIYSIAVDDTYGSNGTGSRIITFLIQKAMKLGLSELFLLTTQTTDWFIEMGFHLAEVESLPKKKQEAYNWERRSRVLTLNLTTPTVIRQFSSRL